MIKNFTIAVFIDEYLKMLKFLLKNSRILSYNLISIPFTLKCSLVWRFTAEKIFSAQNNLHWAFSIWSLSKIQDSCSQTIHSVYVISNSDWKILPETNQIILFKVHILAFFWDLIPLEGIEWIFIWMVLKVSLYDQCNFKETFSSKIIFLYIIPILYNQQIFFELEWI